MPTINQKNCSKTSCNFARATLLLGDVWNLLILDLLLKNEKVRFGEFVDNINGIGNSVLSARLKNLVDKGILDRESILGMPPQVIYSLTSKGQKLRPIFMEIQRISGELV